MNSLSRCGLTLMMGMVLGAQVRPSRTSTAGRGAGAAGLPATLDAVASFDGVFKTADKKFVEIQMESGDVMRMYITHGTKFVLDGKVVKSSAFHDGDKVTADATRDARLNMLAVKIENRKPEEQPAK